MKVELPRRRWIVLAGCLAVIGCGFVLMYVEYVEVQRRYQRMADSYERVRMGMTPSEVLAAVGQQRADQKAWDKRGTLREHWEVAEADEEVPAEGQVSTWTDSDCWVDHDVVMFVTYRDGKAVSKSLVKTTLDWLAIADDWFARLRRFLSP